MGLQIRIQKVILGQSLDRCEGLLLLVCIILLGLLYYVLFSDFLCKNSMCSIYFVSVLLLLAVKFVKRCFFSMACELFVGGVMMFRWFESHCPVVANCLGWNDCVFALILVHVSSSHVGCSCFDLHGCFADAA